MCNYPQQNDILLETSGRGGKEKKTHTQPKIYGHDTAQTHAREPKKPMRMTQNWHVICLKLVLFGVDAGVINTICCICGSLRDYEKVPRPTHATQAAAEVLVAEQKAAELKEASHLAMGSHHHVIMSLSCHHVDLKQEIQQTKGVNANTKCATSRCDRWQCILWCFYVHYKSNSYCVCVYGDVVVQSESKQCYRMPQIQSTQIYADFV